MPATRTEVAEIVAAERLRIMGILDSPEGKKHPKSAQHFALNTALTVEQASATLANLPVESPFFAAMEQEGPLGVKASAPGATGTPMPEDAKAARLAELEKAGKAVNNRRSGRA